MAKKPKKILVVEDERAIAKAMSLKLELANFEVKNASDGEEAFLALKEESFDLIILDLIMPKMDGFEFLEELKKQGVKIPVIVSTNLSQKEDLGRAKKLGAVDYLVKSDTPIVEVVEHVKKILKV